jgi:hypothetical protein
MTNTLGHYDMVTVTAVKKFYNTGSRRQRGGEMEKIKRQREIEIERKREERQAYGPGDGDIEGQIHGETEV